MGVYVVLNKRRGKVLRIKERSGTPYIKIQASLPVAESFGFTQELRKITSGRAFPRMKFSHWQVVGGDPLKDGSSANKTHRPSHRQAASTSHCEERLEDGGRGSAAEAAGRVERVDAEELVDQAAPC